MAEISPFRGVRYNQSLVGDLAAVACPPYDVINPQKEQALYATSPYNFIRIEQGRQTPQDTPADNKYTRAAATLNKWLDDGVVLIDPALAIYLHDHSFICQGKSYRRRGIVVRVRLEEWDSMVIRPHEGTLAGPKSDRMSLLWELKANTSPVLSLYEDSRRQVASRLDQQAEGEPIISLASGGESHRIWAITDPEAISAIAGSLAPKPLYIADGHHRYETALVYRREQRTLSPSLAADDPRNYVMMTLVDFNDPGLIILPPHRLLRGLPSASLDGLMAKLDLFFEVDALPLDEDRVWPQVDELLEESGKIRLVLFGLKPGQLLVLTLRDLAAAGQMMPYFHSEAYKKLDVSVVDHVILEELLAMSSDEVSRIDYNYDRQDAVRRVAAGEYQLAFILKPVSASIIKDIADAGDRMPRKSTYFYPKLPSGLLINRLR
jgi:uncharacterized protein (DUF1015 family)